MAKRGPTPPWTEQDLWEMGKLDDGELSVREAARRVFYRNRARLQLESDDGPKQGIDRLRKGYERARDSGRLPKRDPFELFEEEALRHHADMEKMDIEFARFRVLQAKIKATSLGMEIEDDLDTQLDRLEVEKRRATRIVGESLTQTLRRMDRDPVKAAELRRRAREELRTIAKKVEVLNDYVESRNTLLDLGSWPVK